MKTFILSVLLALGSMALSCTPQSFNDELTTPQACCGEDEDIPPPPNGSGGG